MDWQTRETSLSVRQNEKQKVCSIAEKKRQKKKREKQKCILNINKNTAIK